MTKIKRAQLKRFGPHIFDKRTKGFFPVEKKTEVLPEIPDHDDNFCHKNIDILKNEYSNTFLYTEYLKRKFYIDCTYKKEKENFIRKDDQKKSYIKKIYENKNEFIDDIRFNFLIESDQAPFLINYNINENFIKTLEDTQLNIYSIIKILFQKNLDVIRNILTNPEDYPISSDDKIFIKSLSLIIDDYFCERCLYFHRTRDEFVKQSNFTSDFNKLLNIIGKCRIYFDFLFLTIYKNIIDKYSLYMTDIFDLTPMEEIINNNYSLPRISRYFFLPHEPEDNFFHERTIDINLDYVNEKINISIDLYNNFDTIFLSKFIYECLICSLYNYKNITGKFYSTNEISYFIEKINFTNSFQTDLEDRINGLYIWDKIYLKNYPKSINTLLNSFKKNFLSKINNNSKYKSQKSLRRLYTSTRDGIEDLQLKPIK